MKLLKRKSSMVQGTEYRLSERGNHILFVITDEEVAEAKHPRALIAEHIRLRRRDLRHFIARGGL